MVKRAFDHCAADYARFRPPYPDALFEALPNGCGQWAVDIGAGTGIFSRGLVSRGWRTVAVEPSLAMLGEIEPGDRVLQVASTAEATGIADTAIDLVVCAQSFHWFNPPYALAEIGRILKPGGLLLLVWNNRDLSRSRFVMDFEALVAQFNPSYRREYRQQDWAGKIATAGGFSLAEHRQYQHDWSMSADDFVGFTRSVSYIRNVLSRENRPLFERALRELIATHFGNGQINIPLRTDAWFATRLSE